METSRSDAPAPAPPFSELLQLIPNDLPVIRLEEAGVPSEGVSQRHGVSPGREDAGLAEPRLEEHDQGAEADGEQVIRGPEEMEKDLGLALKQDERDLRSTFGHRSTGGRPGKGTVTWCASTLRWAKAGANTFEKPLRVSEQLWC